MTIYRAPTAPPAHHEDGILSTCPECEKYRLKIRMAKKPHDREFYEQQLAKHRGEVWHPAQPSLIEGGR